KPPVPNSNAGKSVGSPGPTLRGPHVRLHAALNGNSFGIESVEVARDGSFVFQNVPPGRYVFVVSWPNAYVKSMQLAPAASDGPIVDLSYGAGGTLSVVMSSMFGEISGMVDGGAETAKQFAVMALPDPREQALMRRVPINPDGSYRLDKLPPGK